jgi:hypothetical protein
LKTKPNPFLYPQAKHRRRLRPGPFTNYRDYKPALQEEFTKQCVYCRIPDNIRTFNNFGVDHYKPQWKFPELECVYVNLYYACNTCNSLKGKKWLTDEEQAFGLFIPNPCDHVMFEHLRFRGADIETRTLTGAWADAELRLSADDRRYERDMILRTISRFRSLLSGAEDTLSLARVGLRNGVSTDADVASAEANVAELQQLVDYWCGK